MKTTVRGLAVLALLVLAPCARAVSLITYTFAQPYADGAYMTGWLNLYDANGDGIIVHDRGDTLVGAMALIGHQTIPNVGASLFRGTFNLSALSFSAGGGDSPGSVYNAFVSSSGNSGFGINGYGNISSSQPITLVRVPDALPVAASLLVMLLGLIHFKAIPTCRR